MKCNGIEWQYRAPERSWTEPGAVRRKSLEKPRKASKSLVTALHRHALKRHCIDKHSAAVEWRRRAWRCSEALRICAEEIGNGTAWLRKATLSDGTVQNRKATE